MDSLRLPGAREGLNTRKYKVYAMAELYDPKTFSAAVLAANKAEWVADVKEAFMDLVDFASRAKANPESTPVDQAEIDNVLGSVKVDYAKFLADFSAKCIITPDITPDSESSVNGNAIAVQNVEKIKAAEIEVKIIKEKIDKAVSRAETNECIPIFPKKRPNSDYFLKQ